MTCICLCMSCAKDSDTIIDVTDNLPEVKEKIFASFTGLILDEQESTIEDAFVMIGGESSTTDENGFFTISGFFNPDGTLITVSKDGYFDANGRLIPYPDVPVNTKVKLISKSDPVKDKTDKIISYDTDFANVTFKENSYTIRDVKYEGIVEVIGTSIDIEDPEYSLYSPGSMETFKDEEFKILFPFGRVNVELYSESGERVDIDAPAEIRFDISEELAQRAPDEIPLWYLDTNTGLWIEDGIAIKDGNTYKGEVTHFTDWCVGLDVNLYEISGVVTRNGEVYPNANMGVNIYSFRLTFKSAADGSYRIPVYDFEEIVLDVSDQCDAPIYEQTIIQISSDLVQNIDINQTANSFVVSGKIYCEDPATNVEGGYVLVNFENSQFSEVVTTDENGEFTFFYEDCSNNDISLIAYDPNENKQSSRFNISGNSEDLEIDVCKEEITGAIRIEIDGEDPYIISGCTVEISDFDGLPGYVYVFSARDNFNSLPNVNGEYVDYKIIVNVSIPGELQLPYAPISSPIGNSDLMSDNAPFFFDVVPASVTILSENDEFVVIKTNDMFPISRWENGVRTEFNGQIILEGIKN